MKDNLKDFLIAWLKSLSQMESKDYTEDSKFLWSEYLYTEHYILGNIWNLFDSCYDSGKRAIWGDD